MVLVSENPETLQKVDGSGNQKEEQKKTETGDKDNKDIIYFLEFLIYRIFQKSLRWMT